MNGTQAGRRWDEGDESRESDKNKDERILFEKI